MIENFTEEEIKQLIEELKPFRGKYEENSKTLILRQVANEVFGKPTYVCDAISRSMFAIADDVTDNYERIPPKSGKGIPKTYKRRNVPKESEDEYRRVLKGILEVLKPHYGKLGLRERRL